MRSIDSNQLDLPQLSAAAAADNRGFTVEGLSLQNIIAGGGVDTLKADEITPIRLSGIKGQLRFWWRSFQRCTDAKSLLKAETALWGGIAPKETRSKVTMAVRLERRSFPKIREYYNSDQRRGAVINRGLSYAFFPWDNTEGADAHAIVRNADFSLVFGCDQVNQLEEVKNTVGLWLVFGGVGSRTRRGVGALNASRWLAEQWQVTDADSLRRKLDGLAQQPGFEADWPVLRGSRLYLKETNGTAESAWKDLIRRYAAFRQMRNGPFGRSRWPEPDALRRITGSAARKHAPIFKDDWFPRAAFGLPIIFHFKDAGDPTDVTLAPAGDSERWASPVIIKAIQLGEKAYQLILVLHSPFPEALQLSWPSGKHSLDKSAFPSSRVVGEYQPLQKDATGPNLSPVAALFHQVLGVSEQDIGTIGGPL
jgi:CRISPR-associated protein Cmr1